MSSHLISRIIKVRQQHSTAVPVAQENKNDDNDTPSGIIIHNHYPIDFTGSATFPICSRSARIAEFYVPNTYIN